MEITALTRSIIEPTHAIISPDGYINSNVPGWQNCTVNVIINEQMSANFCQTIITAHDDCSINGTTNKSQLFFYIIEGDAYITVNETEQKLDAGGYVYIPIGKEYKIYTVSKQTKLLSFHKQYEKLDNYTAPETFFGNAKNIMSNSYMNDGDLQLQVLLPDNMQFDMAVNIFSYKPGGNLPMVETHVMEHGLLFLQGQGIYMLSHKWYPVKKGDCIWMAPYCQQWFTAMGKEPAIYIYYKNINRFPSVI